MDERKIVDLSHWNTITDYSLLKNEGCSGAILKAINNSYNADKAFEKHLQGCVDAGLNVIGTYHYSYAKSVSDVDKACDRWVEIVKDRAKYFFLDWEDKVLPKDERAVPIINRYAENMKSAGVDFAIYTGLYWYKTYIKPYNLDYDFWLARYYAGYSEFNLDTPINSRYKPECNRLMGWQYTSSLKSKACPGSLDCSVWYRDVENSVDTIKASTNPYTTPTQNVKLGSMGNDANWVLWYLWKFGLLFDKYGVPDVTKINGMIEAENVEQIKVAQYRLGVVPDGIVGRQTRAVFMKVC